MFCEIKKKNFSRIAKFFKGNIFFSKNSLKKILLYKNI